MSSSLDAVTRYLQAPKTVGLFVATALAIAAGYATLEILVSSDLAFLVLIVLGVSVPTTLESYGLLPDALGRTALVVVAACLAHWVVFLVLYLAAVSVTGELAAASVAFVVTVVASAVVGRSVGE